MLPPSADATSDGLNPGAMLGKYRVGSRLGEGAMGVVYSAVHERLGRPVAIKVLRRELSENTELSGRFQMEAELVTRIGHPSIVAVYDFGRLPNGSLYYVMEKIQGESLRSRLERGTLSDQEIVEVFGPLMSALRAAHEIGVVHRDLKPDNVMLLSGADGTLTGVKLLDFGIAKIRDEQPGAVPLQAVLNHKDSLATAAGAIMGTPAYMSPEQIQNSSGVDKRADIYALGIMLYEALAGERPFDGASSAEIMGAHMYKKAELPSKVAQRHHIPRRQVAWPKIDPVVLRALAKTPAERYQDCAGLQADLEAAWGRSFALVRGAALTVNPAEASLSGLGPVGRSQRRRPKWPFLVAAAAALALGVTGVVVLNGKRVQPVTSVDNEHAAALFTAARDGEPTARKELLETIEMVGGRAHLATIAQGLGDEDTGVWRAALAGALLVGQPGDTILAEPLATLATQAVGPHSVEVAAARLRIGEPEAQATLTSMLQSPIPTPEARLRAAIALAQAGQLPAGGLRQALEAALRAGSLPPLLRRAALVRLAVLHDPEALKQISAVAHPTGKAASEEAQRNEAMQVLALAQQPHGVDDLRHAAESAKGGLRLELATTLAEVGDPQAVSILRPLLKSKDAKERKRALGALCRLATSGHFPAYPNTLKPLLSDADPQIALTAAVALLEQSPPSTKAVEPAHE